MQGTRPSVGLSGIYWSGCRLQPAERLSPHNPDNKTNLGTTFHFCGTTALHFFKVQFSVLCCDSVFMVWSHLGAKKFGKVY